MAAITVEGLKQLAAKLRDMEPKQVKPVLRKALRDGAKQIQTEAKALVPVDEGNLQKEIKVKSGKGKKGTVNVQVRTESPYVIPIEYGKRTARAHPFLRPAAASAFPRVLSAITSRLRTEVSKHA